MIRSGRIEGYIHHSHYVIRGPQGVIKEIPLAEAREDSKLLASIRRNGWEQLPDA